jgi:hypothetical protein
VQVHHPELSTSTTEQLRHGHTEDSEHPDALAYWDTHRATYHHLADTALDLVAASALQAFVERIFSVCGMLTQGRRNRMLKSLEMRVPLKLNAKLFA